jgi:hypothetical protein
MRERIAWFFSSWSFPIALVVFFLVVTFLQFGNIANLL